jgi:regulator of sigma E protease
MNIGIAIFGLAVLILLHEAGHFFAARAVAMNPRKFYVGFPPALAKVTRNGIEYGLGAIPLGGYVKIPGMHRPAPADASMYFDAVAREAPSLLPAVQALKRHLEVDDLAAARAALRPLEAARDDPELSPPARKALERGLRELGDALGGDAYWRAPTWKRVAVVFAGPATNLLIAFVLFTGLYMVVGGEATTTVDEVVDGRPAAEVGLRPGDRIVAINRVTIREPADIPRLISSSGGRPLTLVVERDGRPVVLGPVRPQKLEGAYRLGFLLRGRGLSPPDAAWTAVRFSGRVTVEIGRSLGRLVQGEGRKEIASPVGIVDVSSNALEQGGVAQFLGIMGLISLSLALLNLLPLLPLDGGHIAFSIVEGLRGRAVGRAVYERVSAVGIALVLLLFFIGLSNDINRLGGG